MKAPHNFKFNLCKFHAFCHQKEVKELKQNLIFYREVYKSCFQLLCSLKPETAKYF